MVRIPQWAVMSSNPRYPASFVGLVCLVTILVYTPNTGTVAVAEVTPLSAPASLVTTPRATASLGVCGVAHRGATSSGDSGEC